jgi:hypothetical protein
VLYDEPLRADRPLRLPLQIGTSALYSLARGSAFAVPGIILFAFGAAVLWEIADALSGDAGGYIVVALLGPGFVTCGFAYKHLRRARRERPSDLVITPQGATIRGGPHDRFEIAWAAIDQVRIDTPPKPGKGSSDADDSDLRVLVVRVKGKELQLASAERPAEQQSLRELQATLIAASSAPVDHAKEVAPANRVDQLACAECGAALAPVDAAETKCPYCDHITPVADAIRQQVRDSAALASRPDAQIAKLLDQPRAGSVGAMYLVAALFMLVAWPLAVFMMVFEAASHTLTPVRGSFLIGFVLACIAGFYALIRTRLVDRQALRLVAVDFAALEPAKPGEPYRCQRCVAPLPDAPPSRSVVRCVYCRTDNVLGLFIGRRASAAREESASLADALAIRRRERRRWRGVSVVALGLLGVAWWALRHGVGH